MKPIDGLREIADQFDLCLVDQYGVLHDGARAYPGAIEGLYRIASSARRVVVLTNSGKGAAANRARLAALGFASAAYDVLSSGEVALQAVKAGAFGQGFAIEGLAIGSDICVIGRAGDSYAFSSDDFTLVPRPEDAAYLVIAGSDAPRTSLDAYRGALATAAQIGVPAICVNPDITMLRDGALVAAPGAIAGIYQELGGRVDFVGKPHRLIFQSAHALCDSVPISRVVMIGDSPEHDMAGARAMGFATLLVRTGIHADLSEQELLRRCASHGGAPDFLIESFRW
jgi:HAD superfamily hydrolase (TIGR01459 family)